MTPVSPASLLHLVQPAAESDGHLRVLWLRLVVLHPFLLAAVPREDQVLKLAKQGARRAAHNEQRLLLFYQLDCRVSVTCQGDTPAWL